DDRVADGRDLAQIDIDRARVRVDPERADVRAGERDPALAAVDGDPQVDRGVTREDDAPPTGPADVEGRAVPGANLEQIGALIDQRRARVARLPRDVPGRSGDRSDREVAAVLGDRHPGAGREPAAAL